MSDRHKKAKATKEANRAAWDKQTITIDEHWRIIRFDEMNWELQKDQKFQGYFGTLYGAFRALPAKMLSAEARGSLHDVQRRHSAIVERIDQTLNNLWTQ